MVERFKNPAVLQEVTKLVRLSPEDALDVPEALPLFLGDKTEIRGPLPRNLKVRVQLTGH